ncbi:hypothetical protein [Paraburkholderia flagellata]|uniref:hypothetical protein n=1 Tax=Paraburkholderia flagellata TaxID=2883241 RepID=UPI001F464E4A|nr:hypothetical protein [Paraburkholderia flagellata]
MLEALAFQYADLVMSCDIEYSNAVWRARHDAVTVMALFRRGAGTEDYEDIITGLGERVEFSGSALSRGRRKKENGNRVFYIL